MLYPELLEEAKKHIEEGNPELAEFSDWLHLKANLLGHFPDNLKRSKELLDWIMYTNYMVHPTAIVASYITILSSITARAVFTETGCSTSLFTIAIAPTGSGKDIVTDIPRIVISKVNRENSDIIQSKIFSEGALDDIFREKDIVIQIIDEFGDQLGQMLSDGSGHLKALMQKYKTLYSSTNGVYESARYSSSGGARKKVEPFTKERPAFVLTGITTKIQLFSRLKEAMLYDGFLNRFIIMDGSKMAPWTNKNMVNKTIPQTISRHLSTFITDILVFKKVNVISTEEINKKDYLTLKMSSEAREYYHKEIGTAYEEGSDIYNFCKNDKTELMQEISVRWRENSLRLATAMTAYELSQQVELETLKWCYNFVKTMSLEFLKSFQDEANKTKYEQLKDKAIQWFKTQHDVLNPWHQISLLPQKSRVFRSLNTTQRKSLINDLVDEGIVEKSNDGKQIQYLTN